MAEPTSNCCPKIAHDLHWEDRQKLLPEVPTRQSDCHIYGTIDEEQPHGREMPEQPAGEPSTKCDRLWKGKAKQRRSVVDLPTRSNHDQRGQRIDPMRYPHITRMDNMVRQSRGGSLISGHPRVPVCAIAHQEYTYRGRADALFELRRGINWGPPSVYRWWGGRRGIRFVRLDFGLLELSQCWSGDALPRPRRRLVGLEIPRKRSTAAVHSRQRG